MKKIFKSEIFAVGLAIFSMFFGAGNLMLPIKAGMESGSSQFFVGMFAFLITSVALPLLGLIAMILFEGNYKAFLFRIGKVPGYILLLCCMFIMGPLIATPRIITLSYIMMSPFLPQVSLFVFTLAFLTVTFFCAHRESKIVDLLGKVISPALVISLAIIIFKGIINSGNAIASSKPVLDTFKQNFWRGYETLDLLGAIFFSSIILHILKMVHKDQSNTKLAILGLKSGLISLVLLGFVYVGMGFLGLFHGYGLESVNSGELFKEVSLRVLGSYGAIIISMAVFMACLSTAIALAAVVAEFVQLEILKNKISFRNSLILVLLSCIPLSLYGLDTVLWLTGGPITYIGYPMLITITILNIAYKLFDFKPIKIPVLIVGILALVSYLI